MKIVHREGLRVTKQAQKAFAKYGIHLEIGMDSFKVDEDHEHWPEINKLAKKFRAIDSPTTYFSDSELENSRNICMRAAWNHGYPEPSGDAGYLSQTYNLDGVCLSCKMGKVQVQPFKFKREPKWGKKNILQLYWIYDEFFTTPDFWNRVFKPFGIGCKEVVHVKTGATLTSVVQIDIPDVDVSFVIDAHPSEPCDVCGRERHKPIIRGYHPPLSENVVAPIFRPNHYFGHGRVSFREVVISNDLYLSMRENGAKGVDFLAIANI